MWKYILAFVSGTVLGGGASWFFLKEKFEEKYEADVQEAREYYASLSEYKQTEEDVEDADFYEPENKQTPPKAVREKRKGSFATDYTAFYRDDPADEEHPQEEEVPVMKRMEPKLIKYEDFGEDGFKQETFYYYTEDEALVGEGETRADIIDEDEVRDIIGNALTKFGFADESNDERCIYVRNFDRNTDYEIIKVRGSLEDGG